MTETVDDFTVPGGGVPTAQSDYLSAYGSGASMYNAQDALKDPLVFMGPGADTKLNLGSAPLTDEQLMVPGRSLMPTTTAISQWYAWDEEERKKLAEELYQNGIIDSAANMDAAFSMWQAAVNQAANFQLVGKDVTPWQIIENQGSYNKANGIGPGGQEAPQPSTSTNTNYSYLDPAQAELTVKNMFQEAVGRAPTGDELERYSTMIISASHEDPSTTVTSTDGRGNTTSRFTPGFTDADAQEQIDTKLANDPESGAYQAVSSYFPLLEQLMGGA